MALRFLLLLSVVIACASATFRSVGPVKQVIEDQITQTDARPRGDRTIFAAAVVSVDSTGVLNEGTFAAGFRNPELQAPMMIDNSLRANAAGELLLGLVTMQLIDQQLLPTLDSSIPASLFPKGVTLVNPNHLGVPLTLRHLLTHTSSLRDSDRFVPAPVVSGGGNSVLTLAAFCEAYFVAADGPTRFSAQTDIWGTEGAPGPNNYGFAQSNIALLSFIVETALRSDATKVKNVANPLAAYIEESIFGALGMTGSYFLNRDGSTPLIEGGFRVFDQRKVSETTQNEATTEQVPIRAPFLADAMFITSAADLAKLVAALFVNTASAHFRLGQIMRTQVINVTDARRPGVIGQGFGIVEFDAAFVCSAVATISDTTAAGCSLTSNRQLYGVISIGDQTAVSAVCTTAPLVSGQVAQTACTTTVHAFYPVNAQTTRLSLAAAGAALNNAFIDPALFEGDTFDEARMTRSGWFSFSAFLGLFGTVVAVLLFAYFAEYFIHPAPLAGAVATDAYPKLEQVIAQSSPFRDRR